MTRDDAVTLIQSRLGSRFDTRTKTLAELELRLQQEMLEQQTFLPWFLFQESQIILNLSDPTPEIFNFPEGFLREYSEDVDIPSLWWQDDAGVWKPIPKKLVMSTYLLESSSGPPLAYSVVGERIRLWPVPDKEYSLRLYYYKAADVLSSNIENGWLKYASQLLWGKAGAALAVNFRDSAAVDYFTRMADMAQQELIRTHITRQEANFNAMTEN